jgi:hypothetical protein
MGWGTQFSESGNIRVYHGIFHPKKVAQMVDAELKQGYDLLTIAGGAEVRVVGIRWEAWVEREIGLGLHKALLRSARVRQTGTAESLPACAQRQSRPR